MHNSSGFSGRIRSGVQHLQQIRLTPIHLLFLLAIIIGLGGCKSEPTEVVLPPKPATPIWEQSILPTPTLEDSGLEVVDDGSALPIQVIERHPAAGQELSITGEVLIHFNQAMDAARTAGAWKLTDSDGRTVRGKISWPDEKTMQFKPTNQLELDSAYQIVIEKSAASAAGRTLAETIKWNFDTVSELEVSQTFPADRTFDVANDTVITTIFNRPVVPLVIAEERDALPNPLVISPPVSGRGEWVNTSVFAFRPDVPLQGGTTYSVTIREGLSDALDESSLANDYIWHFTTITPSIEYFELASGVLNPEHGRGNVLLDESFIIQFAQPMDIASAELALRIVPSGASPIPLTTAWNEENTRLTVTPQDMLGLETSYTFWLDPTAKSIHGNSLADGLKWTFSTISAPEVLYISPPEGDRFDQYSPRLGIQFASPMKLDSVKERIVIEPEPEGEIQWWYNQYRWNINAYILKPSTNYVVRALAGMEDLYGNVTEDDFVVEGPQLPDRKPGCRCHSTQLFCVLVDRKSSTSCIATSTVLIWNSIRLLLQNSFDS
jgi:hypothetical protein